MSCAFDGNNDLYGIGIRVGVYLSLASTIYAKYHLPGALSGALVTNAIFIFALLVAILQNVVSGELRAVEGYIMLQVIFGFVLCSAESGSGSLTIAATAASTVSKPDFELAMSQFSRTQIAEHALGLLRIMCAAINLWFWFRGINHLDDAAGCSNFNMFFFARFNSDGDIRKLFQAMATLYLIQQLIRQAFLVYDTMLTYQRSYGQPHLSAEHNAAGDALPKSSTAIKSGCGDRIRSIVDALTTTTDQTPVFLTRKTPWAEYFSSEDYTSPARLAEIKTWLRYFRRLLLTRDSVMLVWTVLTVELGLKWNHIGHVNMVSTTGQLIPLVIGITNIIPSLSELVQKTMKKQQAAIVNQVIEHEKDGGKWQYAMRNGKIIAFENRSNVRRRWSADGELRSSPDGTSRQIPSSGKERRRTEPKSTSAENLSVPAGKFAVLGGFTTMKLKSELRGPPLYPDEGGWRVYYPLNDGTLQAFNAWVPTRRDHRRHSCPHARELDERKKDTDLDKNLIEWSLGNTAPRIFWSQGASMNKETALFEWEDVDWTKPAEEALRNFKPQILTNILNSSVDVGIMDQTSYMVRAELQDWRNGTQRMGLRGDVRVPNEILAKARFYLTRYDYEALGMESRRRVKHEEPKTKMTRSSSMNDMSKAGIGDLRPVEPLIEDVSCSPSWGRWRMRAFHLLTVLLSLIILCSFIIFLPFLGPWLITYMQFNMKWMIWPQKQQPNSKEAMCMVTVKPAIVALFWYLPRCIAHSLLRPKPEYDIPNGILAGILYEGFSALPSNLSLLVFGGPLFLYIQRKPVYDDVLYTGDSKKEGETPKDEGITTKIMIWIEWLYYSKSFRQIKYVLWPVTMPVLIIGLSWKRAFALFRWDLDNAHLGTPLQILAWTGYFLAWATLPVTLVLFVAWYLVYYFLYIRKQAASNLHSLQKAEA